LTIILHGSRKHVSFDGTNAIGGCITGHDVAVQVLLCDRGKPVSIMRIISSMKQSGSTGWLSQIAGSLQLDVAVNIASKDQRDQSVLLTPCPRDLEWYKHFDKSLKKRIGQDRTCIPNLNF
jgi:hypothetical protein